MLLPGRGRRQQKCVGGMLGMSCCRGQGVSGARISGNLRAGQPFRWAAVCASGGKCVGWRRLAAGDARLSRLTSPILYEIYINIDQIPEVQYIQYVPGTRVHKSTVCIYWWMVDGCFKRRKER